jgi:hypothetical protein
MDRDFKVSPYKRYLLPTCKDVQLFQNEYGVKAHSEIISWFVKSRNYKYGVKEKVEAILNKRRIPTQRERGKFVINIIESVLFILYFLF